MVLYRLISQKTRSQIFLIGILAAILSGVGGCKGTSTNPTSPTFETPTPEPTVTVTVTPDEKEPTPVAGDAGCDNYGESAYDTNLEVLRPEDSPFTISMDCTGDVDWYKIELTETPVTLKIVLSDLSQKSDYDMIAYDDNIIELQDGRSSRTGNVDEELLLTVDEELLYVQIYSYNGSGTATLTLTTEASENEDEDEDEDETNSNENEEPEENEDDDSGTEIDQLTYEDILSQEFASYPRGTTNSLLERSLESVVTKTVACQLTEEELSGKFTIGNYAHVERDFLNSIDYIDGWALVVFNGSQQLLDRLNITIRVTLSASDVDLDVTVPFEMEADGDDYLVSETDENVYFLAESYGDFLGNSSGDIQLNSGVVGDLGDLFANNIFTQRVEVEWEVEDEFGKTCSGSAGGNAIVDFDTLKRMP